jgi:hypothetical protein
MICPPPHIPSGDCPDIDGLRAFAALVVIAYHFGIWNRSRAISGLALCFSPSRWQRSRIFSSNAPSVSESGRGRRKQRELILACHGIYVPLAIFT